MSKDFGVREGEIAVDLPAKIDAGLYFIGHIRTPWKQRKECPKSARESDAVCTVELDARWAEGLQDVATCSHIILLYWMDKSPRNLVLQVPGHYGAPHGTFALRSPARPNPIAMSVVKLLRIEGGTLSVVGVSFYNNLFESATTSYALCRYLSFSFPSILSRTLLTTFWSLLCFESMTDIARSAPPNLGCVGAPSSVPWDFVAVVLQRMLPSGCVS